MAYPSDLVRTKNWGNEVLTDSDLEGQFDLIINWVMAAFNATTGHSHDGTSNEGPEINITNLTVASQAQGDLIYASSASAWARLGAGTSGQFLKTQGAAANPIWADVGFQTAASQANMEAASDNTVPVTPLAMKWHPGVAKAMVLFNGTGTPAIRGTAYNVTSITDNGSGLWTLNLAITMSSANYFVAGMCGGASTSGNDIGPVGLRDTASPLTTTTLLIEARNHVGTLDDFEYISVIVYGDL